MFPWLRVIIDVWLLLLFPFFCLYRAWRSVGQTSLRHTVLWFAAASVAWFVAEIVRTLELPDRPWVYVALCLTACAGVAIFGARQPGMAAWNFVVGGLLLILLLPLLEQSWNNPAWQIDGIRAAFLAGLLLMVLGNYAPAGAGVFWILPSISAWLTIWWLWRPEDVESWLPAMAGGMGQLTTGFALGWAYVTWVSPDRGIATCSRRWRRFRRRHGVVWAVRVMEQFNASAENAGLPIRLRWYGLENANTPKLESEGLRLLTTLLGRFEGKV